MILNDRKRSKLEIFLPPFSTKNPWWEEGVNHQLGKWLPKPECFKHFGGEIPLQSPPFEGILRFGRFNLPRKTRWISWVTGVLSTFLRCFNIPTKELDVADQEFETLLHKRQFSAQSKKLMALLVLSHSWLMMIFFPSGEARDTYYPVIWKILGLFSSPISREIDHPWLAVVSSELQWDLSPG